MQENLLAGSLLPTGAGTGRLLGWVLPSGQCWMLGSTNAWHHAAVHARRHQHVAHRRPPTHSITQPCTPLGTNAQQHTPQRAPTHGILQPCMPAGTYAWHPTAWCLTDGARQPVQPRLCCFPRPRGACPAAASSVPARGTRPPPAVSGPRSLQPWAGPGRSRGWPQGRDPHDCGAPRLAALLSTSPGTGMERAGSCPGFGRWKAPASHSPPLPGWAKLPGRGRG